MTVFAMGRFTRTSIRGRTGVNGGSGGRCEAIGANRKTTSSQARPVNVAFALSLGLISEVCLWASHVKETHEEAMVSGPPSTLSA